MISWDSVARADGNTVLLGPEYETESSSSPHRRGGKFGPLKWISVRVWYGRCATANVLVGGRYQGLGSAPKLTLSEPRGLSMLQVCITRVFHRSSEPTRRRLARACPVLVNAALVLAACGGSDDTMVTGLASGGTAGTGAAPSPEPEANENPPANTSPTNSAVMVVGQVYSPEGYNTYVAALPEVPEGEVDFARFREFGNANATTHGGYVFVEQDGIMQRFSVTEELELVDGPRFSWQDFGIGAINATSTVFVSSDRAYTMSPDLGVIIVWNPEEMVRTGTLPFEMPERPAGMETFANDGYLVGDKVIWSLFSGNFDTISAYPAVTLVVADASSDTEPARVLEDSRCLPGGPAHVDDAGNYYVHGAGFYGYFVAYGDAGPDARGCALRVGAGQRDIDPDFVLDYQALTGSPVNEPWIHVSGSQYVTRAWDPAIPFPEVPDEFWGNAALRPLLIDTAVGTAVPYPDLVTGEAIDGVTREVDGVSYYQLSQTGYVERGDTDVVELTPEGIRPKFHLSGFLLGLGRIR